MTEARSKARFFHRFICVATAFGSVLATSFVYHALLPPSIPEGVVEKLRFFAAHKDEFDTLFLGSSQIYYAVSPEQFDKVTRENGLTTRSFNFGIDGLHPPETFYVLDQILKTGPRNLKWVFLELDNIQIKSTEANLGTARLLYWHDWPATMLALKKALSPRGDSERNYDLFQLYTARRELLLHLVLFAKWRASVGCIADFFSAQMQEAGNESMSRLGPAGDGYAPVGPPMSGERAARFQRMMAKEVAIARPRLLDAYAEKAYGQWAEKIRQRGAVPLFLVPPRPSQSPFLFRKSPPARLLAFNSYKSYPQFYGDGSRLDEGHLSNESAAEFTRLLGLELVRYAHEGQMKHAVR